MEKKLQKCILHVRFIGSARFMANSLSNLVNNLCKEIHRIKCKFEHNEKKF